MLKIVGLGAILGMVFLCCCSLGTGLTEMLGQQGPSGPFSLPGLEGDATPGSGNLPGLPFPGGKLPIPGLGEVEVDMTQMGELGDVPIFPGAQSVGEKAKLPALFGIFLDQFKAGLKGENIGFGLYMTSDSVSAVTQWYQTQMPINGWTASPGLEQAGATGVLVFERKSDKSTLLILAFEDSNTQQTQIFLLRGQQK